MGEAVGDLEELFTGSSQAAAMLRAFDWSRSPLGPPSKWLPAWRAAVRMMLDSGFPMCIGLGREELVYFQNDLYLPIAAEKFPACFGQGTREVWSDVWDEIGPRIASVLETGEPSGELDQPYVIRRHGAQEETYFSITINALRNGGDERVGFWAITVESTERVLAERRLALLRELTRRAFDADTIEEACRRAAGVLTTSRDVPAALLYAVDEAGHHARLLAKSGAAQDGADEPPPELVLDEGIDALSIAATVRAREPLAVEHLERFCPRATPPLAGFALPIFDPTRQRVLGVLVAAATPLRPRDEVRAFLELVATQLATAFANVREKQRAHERARELAALDAAKSAFFSNVSHELRTPLTLLMGPLTEVLTSGRPSEADRPLLELARRGGSRLDKLIRSMLDFSRVEAARMQAHYEAADLASFTRDVASMFTSAFEMAGIRSWSMPRLSPSRSTSIARCGRRSC